ncbi:MAG: hypothetical protein JJ899_17405 [Alphaproteobacteria bacterium]|nr:hypothetical protein [Alphaproteobacteria bacterium]
MSGKNQGEGNREAAREYNRNATETAKSGDVEDKAKAAKDALKGDQASELEKAEEAGKEKARG